MSDIFFKCAACGKYLVVDDTGAGLAIDCPDCNNPITIPELLIVQECPRCRLVVEASPEMRGEVVQCPSCQSGVRLPGQPQSAGSGS